MAYDASLPRSHSVLGPVELRRQPLCMYMWLMCSHTPPPPPSTGGGLCSRSARRCSCFTSTRAGVGCPRSYTAPRCTAQKRKKKNVDIMLTFVCYDVL